MASPFAKYQSEQVQQIAPGFVEAYGRAGASIGDGIATIGAGVGKAIEDADKKATEEAKLRGSLAPYLKNDQRVQAVEGMIRGGTLVKKDDGTVEVNPIYKDVWDGAKAKPIMDFYNQTGGDGSKLTGTALTKFATELEAQQKYDSAQVAKEDAKLAREETQAKIEKLRAEAAEKTANVTANRLLGEFATQDPFAAPTSAPLGYTPQAAPGTPEASQPAPGQVVTANASGSINLGDIKASTPTGFDVNRYNAGMPLAGKLNAASGEGVKSVVPAAPVGQGAKTPLTTIPVPTALNSVEVVQAAEAERGTLLANYNSKKDALSANRARQLEAARSAGALTPAFMTKVEQTFKVNAENLDASHSANMASIDGRIKSATTVTAEVIKQSSELRDVEKQNITYGQPLPSGATYTPNITSKPGTWANKVDTRVETAGLVPGRMPGLESYKMKGEVRKEIEDLLNKYPAEWSVGIYHEGAKQLQWDLRDNPSVRSISPANQASVQETITGYTEAQSFLQQLNDVVQSTDPGAVRNYLNRMLLTATRDAKSTIITGDMMNQFGVAAFRRAIVSGGNFSDADREYVAKLITNINTLNPLKDKQLLIEQTQALAQFIDQKYRANLSSFGLNFDTKLSRAFLEREGDTNGLKRIEKTESYIRSFGIDVTQNNDIKMEDLPGRLDALAEKAKASGNTALYNQLVKDSEAQRGYISAASKEAKRKEEASKAPKK
jgi:hypothetical protein